MRRGIASVATMLTLLATAGMAGNYTPWPGKAAPPQTEWLELAQKSCCKHCTKGQPCGNTCISKNATCRSAPGCAC